MSFYNWSPPLIGLSAPLLAWLLVAGRASPRRTARLLALAAVVALVVEATTAFGQLQSRGWFGENPGVFSLLTIAYTLAGSFASLLAVASWTVLLAAAARVRSWRRLAVLVVVFALALAFQASLEYQDPLVFGQLREGLDRLLLWGYVLLLVLLQLPALACALLTPPDAPSGETPEPTTAGA